MASYPVGKIPVAIIAAGPYIFTANSADNTVTMLRLADGTVLGTFPVQTRPSMLTYDGNYVWVLSDNGLMKL